jgi:hypothetical protein
MTTFQVVYMLKPLIILKNEIKKSLLDTYREGFLVYLPKFIPSL